MVNQQPATPAIERRGGEVHKVEDQPEKSLETAHDTDTVDWYSPGIVLVLGLVVVVAGINLGIGSLRQPGPGLWPTINGAVLMLTGPTLFLIRHRFERPSNTGAARAAGVALPLFLFVFLYDWAGLIGAGAISLFVITKYVARLSWRKAIVTSLMTPVAVYIVFAVLLGINFRPF